MGYMPSARISRRRVLEGTGVAALGLAGAALLGCGGSPPGGAVPGGGQSAPVTGATGVDTLPLTAPVAQGKPRKGGTYTISMGARTWVEHDSHVQRGASEWHVISEKLLECNFTDAKTLPHVATSWEVADPNGLNLVFKIKPGIKIHNVAPWNGREWDAQDVAWNLERLGGLYADQLKIPRVAFQRASMVQNITKAEAVDKYTVKVTLSAPNSGLFAGVSENRTVMMPKEMDDIGYKDPMKFGGIGPFQMAEVKTDQMERFTKFDSYFRPGEPSFDEAVFAVVPDLASQIAAFSSGQLQTLRPPTNVEAEHVQKSNPNAMLYTWIDCNWHHIRPSMSYQPFQDFRVRHALHLATDYATLGNQEEGTGWGYQAALNPGFQEAWKPDRVRSLPGYNPDTKEQDRAEAKKLMAAAGYPDGKGLNFGMLFSSVEGSANPVAVIFQQQMKSVFPELSMPFSPVDSGTFSRRQSLGEFEALSYTITAVPDAVLEMISQYHTDGSRNYGRFSNPQLDAMLDKTLKELKFEARKELLDEFQTKWVNEWRPMYVMHANAARYLVQPNVGGFHTIAGTWYGYSTYTKICRLSYMEK